VSLHKKIYDPVNLEVLFMVDSSNNLCNELDKVISSRRSVRVFLDEFPPRELIEEVLNAGMQAPYAAQAVGANEIFRRFFVLKKGTKSIETAENIMRKKAEEGLNHFKGVIKDQPFIKPKVEPFMEKLQMFVDNGVLGVGTAPYFIVVAELRGIPPVEQESIAHCMENMWLKASCSGLGFHLVSLTSQMSDNEDFLKLLKLPRGQYGLNGCAIGYPAQEMPDVSRPDTKMVTTWIE
jgi:nitroreductase